MVVNPDLNYSIGMNEGIAALNAEIKSLAVLHSIRMLSIDHCENDFSDGGHLNNQGLATFSSQVVRYMLRDKGVDVVV